MIAIRVGIYLCLEEIIELNFRKYIILLFAYTLNLITPVDYSYEHKCWKYVIIYVLRKFSWKDSIYALSKRGTFYEYITGLVNFQSHDLFAIFFNQNWGIFKGKVGFSNFNYRL